MKPIRKLRRAILATALSLSLPVLAQDEAPSAASAPPDQAVAAAPVRSETMPLSTTQALIMDFAVAGSRAIAVGERGQVLVSESRRDWRQVADVPTRANLTAVATVGDLAWAVGHDGTIIHSSDGGQTWTLQRSDPWQPPSDDMAFDPRQGVPLLDIAMLDAQNGFAIGAYSLILRTRDGGQTWEESSVHGATDAESPADDAVADAEPQDDAGAAQDPENWTFDDADLELDEEDDPHLNAITQTGDGSLFIVAERGSTFRSRDGGETWERRQLPYEGSMFGVIGYEGQRVIAFGMRGNAFQSDDLGDTWTALDTGTELSLMGGAKLPEGGVVLVGANGVVLIRSGAEGPMTRHTFQTAAQETPVLATVLAQSGSELVVGGEKGVGQFQAQAQ